MLLSAILSFSASHLSRFDSSCDALTGIGYHNKCIKELIPALADPSLALDPILPLSTVILRMHEMLTYETDQQRHLRGCSSLYSYNRLNTMSQVIQGTAFWTYIREEILVALPNRSTTNIDTSCWKDEICWEGKTDSVHTNRMTWLAIEVINFCFGEGLKTNPNKSIELNHEIDLWKQSLPDTFKPLYTISDGKPFPKISYLCTWHGIVHQNQAPLNFNTDIRNKVIGMQFYHMAKVLLALYSPQRESGMDILDLARIVEVSRKWCSFSLYTIPFFCYYMRKLLTFIKADIQEHTVELCGMVKCLGSNHPGALVNGVQPLILSECAPYTAHDQSSIPRYSKLINTRRQELKEPRRAARISQDAAPD